MNFYLVYIYCMQGCILKNPMDKMVLKSHNFKCGNEEVE